MAEFLDDIFFPALILARSDKGFHAWLSSDMGWHNWDEYETFIVEEGEQNRFLMDYDDYGREKALTFD